MVWAFLSVRLIVLTIPGGALGAPNVLWERADQEALLRNATWDRYLSDTRVLPEDLRGILTNQSLNFDQLSKATASNRTELVRAFHLSTNANIRHRLVSALGIAGNAETVEMFKKSLTQEYAGQKLTSAAGPDEQDEETVLFRMLPSLGLLAAQHDSAYEFLTEAAQGDFWEKITLWSSPRGRDTAGILSGLSIQSLGITGRPEAMIVLHSLTNQNLTYQPPVSKRARRLHGAVVDAVFYHDMYQQYGRSLFAASFMQDPERIMNAFGPWRETPNGQKWLTWRRAAEAREQVTP